jgi:hypothetical protein
MACVDPHAEASLGPTDPAKFPTITTTTQKSSREIKLQLKTDSFLETEQ